MRDASRIPTTLVAAALVAALWLPGAWAAQTRSQSEMATTSFEIVAIDRANRVITLKAKDGSIESVFAGPDVKRFDELKVGDTVTVRYQESVVVQVRKPGDPPPASRGGDTTVTRNTGPTPGATLSRQMTAIVTIHAIDLGVPSVTIKAEDGAVSSFKVEDKKSLEGFKVGDKVQITYTQAYAVSVEPGKK
jgi:Cu/Ag efflux protein CusF